MLVTGSVTRAPSARGVGTPTPSTSTFSSRPRSMKTSADIGAKEAAPHESRSGSLLRGIPIADLEMDTRPCEALPTKISHSVVGCVKTKVTTSSVLVSKVVQPAPNSASAAASGAKKRPYKTDPLPAFDPVGSIRPIGAKIGKR